MQSQPCDCGGKFSKYNKKKHDLTKKHLKYIETKKKAPVHNWCCGQTRDRCSCLRDEQENPFYS